MGFRNISPYISYPDMVVKLESGGDCGICVSDRQMVCAIQYRVVNPSRQTRTPRKEVLVGMPDFRGGRDCGGGAFTAAIRRSGGYRRHLAGGDHCAAYLMVSTALYSLRGPHPARAAALRLIVIFGLLFSAIWFSRPVLSVLALTYMFSGSTLAVAVGVPRAESPPPTYTEASQTSTSNIRTGGGGACAPDVARGSPRGDCGRGIAEGAWRCLTSGTFRRWTKLLDDDESLGKLEP
jgi:hypothetical protein